MGTATKADAHTEQQFSASPVASPLLKVLKAHGAVLQQQLDARRLRQREAELRNKLSEESIEDAQKAS